MIFLAIILAVLADFYWFLQADMFENMLFTASISLRERSS